MIPPESLRTPSRREGQKSAISDALTETVALGQIDLVLVLQRLSLPDLEHPASEL
jgi:hypothetical protein